MKAHVASTLCQNNPDFYFKCDLKLALGDCQLQYTASLHGESEPNHSDETTVYMLAEFTYPRQPQPFKVYQ